MEWLTTLLLVGTVLYLLHRYLITSSRRRQPPGPKSYPLVGSAFEIDTSRFHFQALNYAQTHGKIVEIKVFSSTIILLNSADIVNKAFCDDEYKNIFNDRSPSVVGKYALLEKSIAASPAGKGHSDLRKALAKGLHIYGDGISKFENIMKTEIHSMMEKIEQYEGREFEPVDLVKRSLSNVISILLLGEPASEEDFANFNGVIEGGDYFFTPLPNSLILKYPFLRFCPPFKERFEKFMLAIRLSTEKMFFNTKETRTPGTIRGLVDFFLKEQEKAMVEGREPLLTDEVIQVLIIESFAAAISTTTSALTSALLLLINNPGYQTRIQEELDSVLGSNREPCVQDKLDHSFNFLEAVVLETLRLASPSPLGLPHICSQNVELEGYQIKQNTKVLANIFFIHHDEKIWGDPWVFRPERFLDENGKLLPSSHVYMRSLLPFGIGRRKCPGLSLGMTRIFLYLSHLLQKWTFTPSRNCMSCDPRGEGYEGGTVLKPKPFYVKARPRKYLFPCYFVCHESLNGISYNFTCTFITYQTLLFGYRLKFPMCILNALRVLHVYLMSTFFVFFSFLFYFILDWSKLKDIVDDNKN